MKKILLLVAAMAAYVGLQATPTITIMDPGFESYELTPENPTVNEIKTIYVMIVDGEPGGVFKCSVSGDGITSSSWNYPLDDGGMGLGNCGVDFKANKAGTYRISITVECGDVSESEDFFVTVTSSIDIETALDDASDKAVVRKTVDNGSLIIIRDGKRYNAAGMKL